MIRVNARRRAADLNRRMLYKHILYVVPEGVPTLFSGDKLYGSGAALGSQTMEALAHTRVPVLACR